MQKFFHSSIIALSLLYIPSCKDYEAETEYHAACGLWNDFVTVGAKIDSAENRLDYILISDILRGIIDRRTKDCPKVTLSEPFPLQHPDLSASNIFVDDDFNITSVIDHSAHLRRFRFFSHHQGSLNPRMPLKKILFMPSKKAIWMCLIQILQMSHKHFSPPTQYDF